MAAGANAHGALVQGAADRLGAADQPHRHVQLGQERLRVELRWPRVEARAGRAANQPSRHMRQMEPQR